MGITMVRSWSEIVAVLGVEMTEVRRPATAPAWVGDAALAAGVLCIAWSGLLVRWAGVSAVTAAFYRMSIAAALLAPWWLWRRGAGPRASGRLTMLAILSGALFACDNVLFNIAVQRTAVSVATLLANVSPLFVGLGSWLFFREKPRRDFWIGLILTTLGCALITGPPALRGLADHGPSTMIGGAALAVVASAFFAGYLMVTQRARVSADTVTLTMLSVCWSAVLLGIACVLLHQPLHGFPLRSWAALGTLGLICQTTGYLAITFALGRLPATVMSVGLLAQAPVTALIAASVVGERLSTSQILGGLLVLAGIYLVARAPARLGEPHLTT
jgi:drug/metabolite transporter (DMT)-like permease